MGDYPQGQILLYPLLDVFLDPFKGTVRTPTALSGQEHRKTRLVAPFCDIFTMPPAVGKVTHYNYDLRCQFVQVERLNYAGLCHHPKPN